MTAINWIKKDNVAQYGEADWKNEVKRMSGLTLEQAQKVAAEDGGITFFFYTRQPMNLGPKGNFSPGDAVFFSGQPWYGSAPQADIYEKASIYWVKKDNVAQFGGADWKNEVKRMSGLTLEQAQKVAAEDARITFFFYTRQPMNLGPKGNFYPGDAVFFSGQPWYGSAPQADTYEKAVINWIKKDNLAQYGGADWKNEVKRMSGLTLEQAQKIAAEDARITFFFYTRQPMNLGPKGNFSPGDAVFFSGQPWYGSAPQADAYEKAIIYWTKKDNVAQYGEADWKNEVKRMSGLTLEQAQKVAAEDARITFFFYTRQLMNLGPKGNFSPGDAVFFSGQPWYGSAPQADAYEKKEVPVWDL